MKKIMFLLLIVLLVGCDPQKDDIDDKVDPKGKFNPEAMITIRPAKGVALRSNVTDLTARQIVEDAYLIEFQSHYFDNQHRDDIYYLSRAFGDLLKDLDTPALKMMGIDVINAQGEYLRDFTYSSKVFITNTDGDTIATVPDSVINAARPLIEVAFADSNYTEVYRIFNEAFVFLPISK